MPAVLNLLSDLSMMSISMVTDCIWQPARDGKWVYSHHVEDFMEPISSLEIDGSGIVWTGHMPRWSIFR